MTGAGLRVKTGSRAVITFHETDVTQKRCPVRINLLLICHACNVNLKQLLPFLIFISC